MIKILMLDLGETLVQGESLFPHVQEALAVLSKFETEAGERLAMSLVSDYDMPKPPVTQQKIERIFRDYVEKLEGFGLKNFFEPVEQRVTLSTQAGVNKPNRLIFEKAIERLGVSARLEECLFITENVEHLAASRKMKMKVLRFDPADSVGADFKDWSEAPLLVARVAAPKSLFDKKLALQLRLSVAYDMEFVSINNSTADTIQGRAKKSFPVTVQSRDGGSERILMPFPVNVEIKLDKEGKVRSVKNEEPDPEALAESAHYVKTLEDSKQVSHTRGSLKPDQTHEIETNEKGQKRLTRKRFTAI